MRKYAMITIGLVLVLTGCGSSSPSTTQSSTTSPHSASQTQNKSEVIPDIRSVDFDGTKISPTIVEVNPPLKIKAIVTNATEVEIAMAENGQNARTILAKIPNPNIKQTGTEQTYEYEWTPPSNFYGAYFWVVAKNGTQEAESAKTHIKIPHNK